MRSMQRELSLLDVTPESVLPITDAKCVLNCRSESGWSKIRPRLKTILLGRTKFVRGAEILRLFAELEAEQYPPAEA